MCQRSWDSSIWMLTRSLLLLGTVLLSYILEVLYLSVRNEVCVGTWGQIYLCIDPLCEDNTVSPKINTKYLHGSVTVKRLRRCICRSGSTGYFLSIVLLTSYYISSGVKIEVGWWFRTTRATERLMTCSDKRWCGRNRIQNNRDKRAPVRWVFLFIILQSWPYLYKPEKLSKTMGICQGNAYKVSKSSGFDDKSHNDQIEKPRHLGSILGLSSIDEQIFSCSDDKSVVVSSWDYASHSKNVNESRDLTILRGHSRAVNCVTSFRDLSGSYKCWTASRDLSVKCVSTPRTLNF